MESHHPSHRISWPRRFAFRFLTLYLIGYIFPFPLGEFTGTKWADVVYDKPWQAIVSWVSVHVFQMEHAVAGSRLTGTADSLFWWINSSCVLALASVGGLAWAAVDVPRKHDAKVREFVRVYVRYFLAATMFAYGIDKVLHLQMSFPALERLVQPYAEMTPKGLLWDFMGYSTAYSVFAGLAEVVGGLLLFFRRTTTLGAIIVAGVMSNVVMFNLCFDIAVKRPAIHLFLFALYLLGPDLRRLANMLVLNRSAEPVNLSRVWPARWMEKSAVVLKALVLGTILTVVTGDELRFMAESSAPKPPHYGAYNVTEFTRDGQVVPPLSTAAARWRAVVIDEGTRVTVFQMDGARVRYRAKFDHAGNQQKLTLRRQSDLTVLVLSCDAVAPGELRLEGDFNGADVSVLLRRVDGTKFPLVQRPFNWVHERVIPLSVPLKQ